MQKIPATYEELQQMTDEEVAALNRDMKKHMIKNLAMFVGVKVVLLYAVHRWAKSVAKNAE